MTLEITIIFFDPDCDGGYGYCEERFGALVDNVFPGWTRTEKTVSKFLSKFDAIGKFSFKQPLFNYDDSDDSDESDE